MKTKIIISGQIFGNYTLRRKLNMYEEEKSGMHNSLILTYRTKAEAHKDLAQCWRKLKEEYAPDKVSGDVYRHHGRVYKVLYDASRAEIVEA
jgi:hypothetical protein